MIKLRNQLNKRGCGLACVAMICDIPYRKVQQDFEKIYGEPGYSYSTRTKNTCKDYRTDVTGLRYLFEENGVRCGRRLMKFKGWEKLPDICVLAVFVRQETIGGYTSERWHWTVYDREQNVVLDPYQYNWKPSGIRTDYKRLRPKYYVKVY